MFLLQYPLTQYWNPFEDYPSKVGQKVTKTVNNHIWLPEVMVLDRLKLLMQTSDAYVINSVCHEAGVSWTGTRGCKMSKTVNVVPHTSKNSKGRPPTMEPIKLHQVVVVLSSLVFGEFHSVLNIKYSGNYLKYCCPPSPTVLFCA
ncbi:hypothetical protein ILYODFUR_017735 [Ilyodon furcidens]|uniref:Uncharacterized protein n=1 Tax=Ilyodon furcidens TaxID=33524 RepID=A0ABV0SP91_9TELE